MTFYHNRTCASPNPPFRESLSVLLSLLPGETGLGLHGVAAQSCRIICGQMRSDKVGLAQSPEVHGHADGWSSSLCLLHSWSMAEQESKWGKDMCPRCASPMGLCSLSHCPSESWGGGEQLTGRMKARALKSPGFQPL